jgi:hypothetical protein
LMVGQLADICSCISSPQCRWSHIQTSRAAELFPL